MKKILYIIFSFTLLFSNCYDDKGNYNYRDLNEVIIDTSGGFQMEYTVISEEYLVIEPVIKYKDGKAADENLSYQWSFYTDVHTSSDWDIISKEKNLNVRLSILSGDYIAKLYVTDNKLNITNEMAFKVKVIAQIHHGIVVLHSENNMSDIDYISTKYIMPNQEKNIHLMNIFSELNGRKLTGNGHTITFVGYNHARNGVDWVFASTDNEFIRLNARNLYLQFETEDLFYQMPNSLNIQEVVSERYSASIYVINDGVLYIKGGTAIEHMLSFPTLPEKSLGEVYLAPHVFLCHNYGYKLIVYDNLGKRFLYHPNSVHPEPTLDPLPQQVPGCEFDVNNMNREMIWMDRGFNDINLSVMKDDIKGIELFKIEFDVSPISDSLSRGIYNMNDLPFIQSATFFETSANGNFILYATQNQLYTYDFEGSNLATLIQQFPLSETITCMKVFKKVHDDIENGGGNLLYIGTWDGTQGKVYEFHLNTSNGLLRDPDPVNVFDGMGRIMSISEKVQYPLQ